ncbi:hypothetical protein HAPAU_37190 [Halalkalicoccus paucihalophilus]|uniref:Uncharacterized protein n=1 Tax=Halalkalicoccus paucihalophilus TaxID=1008153 RepID=A0A151A969_9EURY|nr:hypothetical protein HAPAU_37190 [Halalkalicoccus paucihalophilus]
MLGGWFSSVDIVLLAVNFVGILKFYWWVKDGINNADVDEFASRVGLTRV